MKVKVKKVPKHIEETKQVWRFDNYVKLVTTNTMELSAHPDLDIPIEAFVHKIIIPNPEKQHTPSVSLTISELEAKFEERNKIVDLLPSTVMQAIMRKNIFQIFNLCANYYTNGTLYDYAALEDLICQMSAASFIKYNKNLTQFLF